MTGYYKYTPRFSKGRGLLVLAILLLAGYSFAYFDAFNSIAVGYIIAGVALLITFKQDWIEDG